MEHAAALKSADFLDFFVARFIAILYETAVLKRDFIDFFGGPF